MGSQPPRVVDLAAGNHQAHGRQPILRAESGWDRLPDWSGGPPNEEAPPRRPPAQFRACKRGDQSRRHVRRAYRPRYRGGQGLPPPRMRTKHPPRPATFGRLAQDPGSDLGQRAGGTSALAHKLLGTTPMRSRGLHSVQVGDAGAQVAMALALLRPALVGRLCVVDVSPVRYSTLSSFAEFLRGMRQLDLDQLPDRAAADQALTPYVPDAKVRGFLLQNLRRQPISPTDSGSAGAAWRWQLNVELLDDQLGELGDWPIELSGPYLGPTLWVAGGDSRYVLPEYAPIMRQLFPRVQLVTVKKSGHWVHSDQPEE